MFCAILLALGMFLQSFCLDAGRTECNRVVNFDGDPALIGKFVMVYITEALPNSLRGRLLSVESYNPLITANE